MSLTGQIELYKSGGSDEFRALAEQTLADFLAESPKLVQPRETLDFTVDRLGDVHALHGGGRYGVNHEYSRRLKWRYGGASITVYLQDGWWDYTLYEGEATVDRFSTWPEQFLDPDALSFAADRCKYEGNPALLARLWNVPVERVNRYVKQWGEELDGDGEFIRHLLEGKAYPTDEYSYGWSKQFFDFVRALGYEFKTRRR